MLRCETAGAGARDFEELAVFVSQLAATGIEARIQARSVPEGLGRNAQFDLAPYLVDAPLGPTDRLLVTAMHRATEAGLARLRRFAGEEGRAALACGVFRDVQSALSAQARLGYVLGREPKMLNLADPRDPSFEAGCPLIGVIPRPAPDRPDRSRPRLLIVAPDLTDPAEAAALVDLALGRGFEVAVLTDGKSKQDWRNARGATLPIYQFSEALPVDLATRADICVLRAAPNGNYRLRCLIANLAAAGRVLIDATPDHVLAAEDPAFVKGPLRIPALRAFLTEVIQPRHAEIGARSRDSRVARRADPGPFLAAVGLGPRPRPRPPAPVTVFMPTNGVGLGHAQRCGLIASEMTGAPPVFAAFPSCMRLVKSHGFDVMPLISRSALHAQTHENDLANYLRLRGLTRGGGALVFDGGYVFDSVYRVILENRLRGIWIRRGLWQRGQDNSIALDREKVFDRVIVPCEAFEELNAAYSQGDHVREVGPIVRPRPLGAEARTALRARLAERFGQPFERLVVSLLGGGVAADRGAQIQAICGMMERRADTLHLIVVWPTATAQPVWFNWRRSQVVRTHHAGVIAAAADLCLSAAGYNSFHEVLYNQVPTIFVPQTAAFMDDQRARARAAQERGVAGMVEAQALMTLDREIARALDEGMGETYRARLAALDLPLPGAQEAARLIEEFTDGHGALDRDPVADRPAGRG
jgi:hypothetical protein